MQIVLPVIVIRTSEQVDLILDKDAVMPCTGREVACIYRLHLLPLSYLHVHEVFVVEMRFHLLVLLLDVAI